MKRPRIFDFSARLPGPMAGYLFSKSGHDVFKVENTSFPDPFNDDQMFKLDPIFKYWYQNLNANKKLIRANTEIIVKEVIKNLDEYNIFICPTINKIKAIFENKLDTFNIVFIEAQAGTGDDKNMHDLNAIAKTEVFKLHLKQTLSPPFIPIAGVCFAQEIVSMALMALWEKSDAVKHAFRTAYLSTTTEKVFGPLWSDKLSEKDLFLHTGLFPCYRIYEASDCKVAFACVEEKFWNKFVHTFNLELNEDDRLSLRPEVAKIIEQKISEYKRQDLEEMALGQMCLTII